MKSNFNERRAARKERYEELAEKNLQMSDDRYKAARELGSMIPMGQPILVGHHSENGHRAHIKKIDNNMRKSIEADKKAQYYADRAAAIKETWEINQPVYSDDPEALVKLNIKLEALEKAQERMKATNKICRSKKLSEEEKLLKLRKEFNYSERQVLELIRPKYSYEKLGFQTYALQNNNANINNVKKRIEQLENAENLESNEIIFNDIKILDNVEENRLQIYFPGKPEEAVRAQLKRNGFRWSKYYGCWQRHRSNQAIYAAKQIIGFTE